MPPILIQALALALIPLHLRGKFKYSVAALIATVFLVPGALTVPGGPAYLLFVRLGVVLAAAGVAVRASRGEIEASAIRPTRTFAALGFFVVVAYVLGVARGPYPSQSNNAFELWLPILDQLLFLWVATAAVRVLGVKWMATVTATMVVAVSCIGIVERITGSSYAHWWYEHHPPLNPIPASPLERRGADVRVRATADFSLQFSWVLAMFLPLVGVIAVRTRRLVFLLAPAAVAIAIVLTVTRSALAGVAVGAITLLIFARGDRRLIAVLAVAGVAVAVLYFGTTAVRHPYQAADPASVQTRERRLNIVTQEVAPHPWLGVGLDGLNARGIDSTDSTLLAIYAEIGVVGLAVLVGALGTAAATTGVAALKADQEYGPYAGAVLGGIGVTVLSMFAYDALSSPLSAWGLWLLAALGVGLYEEVSARAGPVHGRPLDLSFRRIWIPAVGLAAGLAVANLAPSHLAIEYRVYTLAPSYLTQSQSAHDDFVGRIFVDTTCGAAHYALGPKVKLDCYDPLNGGPGTGTVRIETRTLPVLVAAQSTFVKLARAVHPATHITVTEPASVARPTWARTAPVTLPVLGAELALLLPTARLPKLRGRRRRRRAAAEAAAA